MQMTQTPNINPEGDKSPGKLAGIQFKMQILFINCLN